MSRAAYAYLHILRENLQERKKEVLLILGNVGKGIRTIAEYDQSFVICWRADHVETLDFGVASLQEGLSKGPGEDLKMMASFLFSQMLTEEEEEWMPALFYSHGW